jgi:NAD-dependent dihydropyrimidine dehydrogenase PreA subunit
MAMFIRIDVDDAVVAKTPGLAAKLAEVCPVNIFSADAAANKVTVVEKNVDECTLCELCIKTTPVAVTVVKLYQERA